MQNIHCFQDPSQFPKTSTVHVASHQAASLISTPPYFVLTPGTSQPANTDEPPLQCLSCWSSCRPFWESKKPHWNFPPPWFPSNLFCILFSLFLSFFPHHVLFLHSSQFSLSLTGCWHYWHSSALNLLGVKSYTQIFAFPVGTSNSLGKTLKFPCGNSSGRSQTAREGALLPFFSRTCIAEC